MACEELAEVGSLGEAQLGGDGGCRQLRVHEQAFGFQHKPLPQFQPELFANSQLTSEDTLCTRTQPELSKRAGLPNRLLSGVSCR